MFAQYGLKRYARSSQKLPFIAPSRLNKAPRGKERRERKHTAFRCLHHHIFTTLPSGLSSRYQSFRIHLQICPPLQQISAERLFPSGWDTVSIEDKSSSGTGFSIVAGHLGFFTQPSNGRMSVSGSLLYACLRRKTNCPRFLQMRQHYLKNFSLTNMNVGCVIKCRMCARRN